MSTQVQYRRGTNAQNAAFTGALAEITVDTTNGTLRVHDGITAGGSNIATVSYVTAQIGALSANSISSGTSNVRVVSSGGNVTVGVGGTGNVAVFSTAGLDITGNITFSGSLVDTGALLITTGSNGNITLTPNGTGVIIASKDILNGQANGVGNIGNATGYFNTIFAKATSAQYADLAEMYVADLFYPPGTVVEFGGTHEITIAKQSHSTAVAGIISTNPSYLMNSTQVGEHVLAVALTGRVPCQVQGPVRKGDVLVASSTPGVAQRIGMNWQPGCVVGKSMEVIDTAEIRTIEVAVGRL
jgi:ribosomal protein S28E/S33